MQAVLRPSHTRRIIRDGAWLAVCVQTQAPPPWLPFSGIMVSSLIPSESCLLTTSNAENCSPPSGMSGYSLVARIRTVAQSFGTIKLFKAYFDLSQSSSPKALSLRSELQTSGVSLTDCPHNGKKEVADNMILGALAVPFVWLRHIMI